MKEIFAGSVSAPLFNAAVAATGQLLTFTQPADVGLTAFFRAHHSGTRDRAFIAEVAYAVVRHWRQLQERTADVGDAVRALRLRVLLAALDHLGMRSDQLDGAMFPAEREWLANHRSRPLPEGNLGVELDLPDWLIERLQPRYSTDELRVIATGLNARADLDLRVNSLKADRATVLSQLQKEGLPASECPFSPLGIRLQGRPLLHAHPLFLDGSIEVQDEGSQLLGFLLQPRRGEMVVDFCAGAGGKTLLLGAMMRSTGRLYAFDISEKRLAKLKPRAARSGLSNIHTACIASERDVRVKRLAGKVDRVLVDAPCSGMGTLRRNPDLKWRQTPEGLNELLQKQQAILASAARMLKVGGRLVYATCSILDEENEGIAQAFLAANPGFRQVDAGATLAAQGIVVETGPFLKLWPHQHGTDGFFAAAMERIA